MNSSNATITSIIARSLVEPRFLAALMRDPATGLEGYSLDESTRSDCLALDWSRVRRFAGFITKVQHNDLWPTMPYTRALLKFYRLEIEVFTEYRERYIDARAAGPVSSSDKAHLLQAFIETYLAQLPRRAPGLLDVVRHERIRWDCESVFKPVREPASPPPPAPATDAAVPSIAGRLVIGQFEYDVDPILEGLSLGTFDPSNLVPRPRWLGYWADPAEARLRILELNELSARALSLVDGIRTSAEIIASSAADEPDLRAGVRRLLLDAQAIGLLRGADLSDRDD
jgi:hypothetical protein